MNPLALLNSLWAGLSKPLRVALLVVLLVIAGTFTAVVAILSWNDGSLPHRLGLVATKADLNEQTQLLASADTLRMQAIAAQAADAMYRRVFDELNAKETEARTTILVPLLEEVKAQRRDIVTLYSLVRDQGREVRALPGQMSRQLEDVLEASRPPKSDAEILREMIETIQAKTDSLLDLQAKPRKRMTKAPTM